MLLAENVKKGKKWSRQQIPVENRGQGLSSPLRGSGSGTGAGTGTRPWLCHILQIRGKGKRQLKRDFITM